MLDFAVDIETTLQNKYIGFSIDTRSRFSYSFQCVSQDIWAVGIARIKALTLSPLQLTFSINKDYPIFVSGFKWKGNTNLKHINPSTSSNLTLTVLPGGVNAKIEK